MKPKHKINVRSVIAHIVLILLSFLCLFFFVILIINATRSHAQLQKGFSFIPGGHFLDNLKSVANDGSFPMFRGIVNSLIISGSCAVLCTYFSSLTAYGLYAYDFKLKKAAFTFIMAILVMPTQVTAMGFLRLITNMGMYDSWTPLIIPSIASPAVFYFMYSYLQSSLPLSLVEAARIDGSNEFRTFNHIVLPIMKPAIAVQAIFTFVGSWNNYFTPALVIQSKNKMTVPILIATLRGAIPRFSKQAVPVGITPSIDIADTGMSSPFCLIDGSMIFLANSEALSGINLTSSAAHTSFNDAGIVTS